MELICSKNGNIIRLLWVKWATRYVQRFKGIGSSWLDKVRNDRTNARVCTAKQDREVAKPRHVARLTENFEESLQDCPGWCYCTRREGYQRDRRLDRLTTYVLAISEEGFTAEQVQWVKVSEGKVVMVRLDSGAWIIAVHAGYVQSVSVGEVGTILLRGALGSIVGAQLNDVQ